MSAKNPSALGLCGFFVFTALMNKNQINSPFADLCHPLNIALIKHFKAFIKK
jgi:hypothetical protein